MSADEPEVLPACPFIRRFPVRSPTLPPATHTNAYVVGLVGPAGLLIVDPASPYPEEQTRLLQYVQGLVGQGHTVAAALLTHHHLDHVSGAAALCAALRVPLWAHPLTAARVADRGLHVGRLLAEGERLPFAPGGLEVLHTPGHAPGHLCLLDAAGGNAIVGDMVASVGTIIIDPDDDGDMRTYLGQLARLRDLGPLRLWPAHGPSIEDGRGRLDFYIAHRLEREAKVLSALSALAALSPAPLAALLPRAYDDVPRAIYPLAARSLLAHLRKLRDDGRAAPVGPGEDAWRLIA